MGGCSSLSKNILCCSREIPKNQKIDINLKKQKEVINESDNQDSKNHSNFAAKLKEGRLKLRTKTFKDNLNSNLLDDSDHIVHLRAKKTNKKSKNKGKHQSSNKTSWKRVHTCRIKRNRSIKVTRKRTKNNMVNSAKKSPNNNTNEMNKNQTSEKEINISFQKNDKIPR